MKKDILFEKNYLTVADIKNYLCTTAYELTHRKDFPVCRLGSSIRIPTQLFLVWVAKHTRIPADLAEEHKGKTSMSNKRGKGEGSVHRLPSGSWQSQVMDGYTDEGERHIL